MLLLSLKLNGKHRDSTTTKEATLHSSETRCALRCAFLWEKKDSQLQQDNEPKRFARATWGREEDRGVVTVIDFPQQSPDLEPTEHSPHKPSVQRFEEH